MIRQNRLELDDPTRPVPTRPTLFHRLGRDCHAEAFDDLKGLAERLAHLADGQAGLRLAAESSVTAYPGFELFAAWSIYALDDAGGEAWFAQAAVQTTARDRLQAAIETALQARRGARAAA